MLPDLASEILSLKQKSLHRSIREIGTPHNASIRIDGKEVALFCSNNYLGLANDARLKAVAATCLEAYGVSAPASRLISGSTAPHRELETRLADFLAKESTVVFPTGYTANIGVIPALVEEGDLIFSDQLNHRSLIDACRLSRAKTIVYDHLDFDDLARKMTAHRSARRRMILTDGVFSMDGDLAPLDRIAEISRSEKAILMVDDAHGTGIFGSSGRGTPEHFGVESAVDVWMTSASKGFGTFGGVIAGTGDLINLIVNRSPAFIYTTAIPPDICAATIEALDILDREPERRETLLSAAARVRESLADSGFDICGSRSHIIPILIGDAAKTLDVADFLIDRGVFVLGIRPPTVPEGKSRLRVSLMATHTRSHIEHFLRTMLEAGAAFGLGKSEAT